MNFNFNKYNIYKYFLFFIYFNINSFFLEQKKNYLKKSINIISILYVLKIHYNLIFLCFEKKKLLGDFYNNYENTKFNFDADEYLENRIIKPDNFKNLLYRVFSISLKKFEIKKEKVKKFEIEKEEREDRKKILLKKIEIIKNELKYKTSKKTIKNKDDYKSILDDYSNDFSFFKNLNIEKEEIVFEYFKKISNETEEENKNDREKFILDIVKYSFTPYLKEDLYIFETLNNIDSFLELNNFSKLKEEEKLKVKNRIKELDNKVKEHICFCIKKPIFDDKKIENLNKFLENLNNFNF